jgi:molybdate transport system substrate-binding protein
MTDSFRPLSWRGPLLAALLVAAAGVLAPVPAAAQDVLVFAAASLKNALDDIGGLYQKASGHKVTVSYAASSVLAKQVENGAPADVFLSADLDWLDYLAGHQLIKPETRINLLGNRLVLIAPKAEATPVAIADGFPLAERLGASGRLAVGDPAHVPAGKYARAALEHLGVWASVADRLAPAASVREALALVSRGEAPLGIVYETDARVDPGVVIVGTFPEDSHPPVIYPGAIVATSDNPNAVTFLGFLRAPSAVSVFEHYGFTVLAPQK